MAPRAQADEHAYAALAKLTLEREKNLTLFQDAVVNLYGLNATAMRGVSSERGGRSSPRHGPHDGHFQGREAPIGEWTASRGTAR